MEELESIFKTGCKWVVSATLPMFALMILFSKELLSIFGSGYADSAEVMRILLIGQMVNVGTGSTGFILSMTGKSLFNLVNSGMLCFLNIGLTAVLVVRYGVLGAAWAYTVSIILIQLLQIVEVWYLYKMHPYRYDHLKSILSCFASLAIIYYLKNIINFPNILISTTILSTLFLMGYIMLVVLAGFSPEERMLFEKVQAKVRGHYNRT